MPGVVTSSHDGADGSTLDSVSSVPLVVAKTAQPVMVRGGVDRPRLLRLLDQTVRKPLTVVRAGAGWGKTVLVSAWTRTSAAPVAWLSLDSYDNDPQTFWSYVVAALRGTGVLTADNPMAEMRSVPRDERERSQRVLAGIGRLPGTTVLVLDDFHVIDDRQVLGEVGVLLRHLPASLRLVLIGRTEPALPLDRLQAADRVGEIRADDLAFTADEATALLRDHGLAPTAEDVTALLHRTDGWATGLRLGASFLAGDGGRRSIADFAGDIRGVDGYLTDEVLAGRPPRQRRFLLETSVAEQMCAGLVNAITTGADGQRMLEDLELDSDFVARLGPKPVWFRYHHLLRDVLRHRLHLEMPSVVPELHRRAARWYAEHNGVIEALSHAVRGEDWRYVGHLVTTQAGPLILSTQRAALVRILRQVPRQQLPTTPELMVCDALLLFHVGDYEAIPARVARIRELLQDRPAASRDPAEVLLMALQVGADRAVGDMPGVIEVETEQLALLARSPYPDGTAAAQYRAIALNSKGLALMWTGDVARGARDLRASSAAAEAVGVELAQINATGHLALLEMMHGSVAEAARLAGIARELAERRAWRYTVQAVAAHFAQALVSLESNDLAAAQEALHQGIRAHESDPEAAQRVVMLGVQARMALARDQPHQARSHLAQARRDRHPRMSVPALDSWLALLDADVDLATGQPERVEQHVPDPPGEPSGLALRVRLARAAYAQGRPRRAELVLADAPGTPGASVATVEAGILSALVADSRGHATQAVDLLADAVRLAVDEGIRRPFVTMAGSQLTALFDRMRLLGSAAAGIIDTLSVAGRPATAALAGESLSDREAEVLRYLPTMLTAAQIAVELGVSVNTVRAHMRSIYRKLQAERRIDAVARARDIGLL
ncbi:LuxR C-terminal-related transcriptional regulator [Actinoplanes missouriensis]|uniref:LuxR C-terminal-related transcriptional regulator n=1 Tax=Actinoplanes missouriensis TaxID=1866 RepID=UPI0033DE6806